MRSPVASIPVQIGVRGKPERGMESLRMMGWGLMVVESSSVVAVAAAVAAVAATGPRADERGGGEGAARGQARAVVVVARARQRRVRLHQQVEELPAEAGLAGPVRRLAARRTSGCDTRVRHAERGAARGGRAVERPAFAAQLEMGGREEAGVPPETRTVGVVV